MTAFIWHLWNYIQFDLQAVPGGIRKVTNFTNIYKVTPVTMNEVAHGPFLSLTGVEHV